MQINPYLSPYTKIKSKWIEDFNIKPDTLNMIEEKLGNNFEHTGTRDNFLNRTLIVQALSLAVYNWNLMKAKSFFKAKDTNKMTK